VSSLGFKGYKRSTAVAIRIDDGAGGLAGITPEAAARFRRKAWKHIKRINPQSVAKAKRLASSR
jgi:hypothetical protein